MLIVGEGSYGEGGGLWIVGCRVLRLKIYGDVV